MTRRFWGMLVVLVMLTGLFGSAAEAATISGTVTNNSGKSGWVYLSLNWQFGGSTGLGKTVFLNSGAAAAYSIVGVNDGSYSLETFVDVTNTGMRHANDPAVTQGVLVSGGNVAQNITIPPAGTPVGLTGPVAVFMVPTDGGAFIQIDNPRDNNGRIIPESYNLSCTSGVTATILAGDNSFALLNGLTNGATLTCTAVPVVNGVADSANQGSSPSTPIGDCNSLPAVFGACPAGTAHVTGQVAFDAGFNLAGRSLFVAIVPPTNGAPIVAAVKTLTNPVTFDVYGVPQGTYKVYAVLDNGNHAMGVGDLLTNDRRAPVLTVDGIEPVIVVPTVTLQAVNATTSLTTNHGRNFAQG
ncbi:MAG TPA: hypothetical protein VIU41_01305, partial [Geobacteraceae bacterium]